MNARHKRFALAATFALLATPNFGQNSAIRIQAAFNPPTITLHGATNYVVTIHGSRQTLTGSVPSVNGLSFSPTPSTTYASGIFNGVRSIRSTISFTVRPQRTGSFSMPAWNISLAGREHQVPPATLRVLPPSQEDLLRQENERKKQEELRQALFLEIYLPRKHFFQGETLPVSLNLHVWERLPMTDVRQPPHKLGEAFSQSQISRPTQRTNVSRNGKTYVVFSWPVALTAAMEGDHELRYRAVVDVKVANTRPSPFDTPFFRDPFLGFGRTQALEVSSDALPVEIRPLPMDARPAAFRGAVGSFVTNTTVDSTQVGIGDPVKVTFSVSGSGNFGVMPAPEFPASEDLRISRPAFLPFEGDENRKLEGAQGFEYVVTPLRPGNLEIPSLPFAYFDPATESYVDAPSSPLPLRVEAGEVWVAPSPSPASVLHGATPAPTTQTLFQTENEPGRWTPALIAAPSLAASGFWYAQIAPLSAFALLLAWRVRSRHTERETPKKRLAQLRAAAKNAVRFNEPDAFHRAIRDAIRVQVGALVGQERPEALATDEVLDILRRRKVSQATLDETAEFLRTTEAREFAHAEMTDIPLAEMMIKAKQLLKRIRTET